MTSTTPTKLHGQAAHSDARIRTYWRAKADEDAASHAAGSLRPHFSEHPVWLGIMPMLLAPSPLGRPIRRVADMGSGNGVVAEKLARLGYQVIAIERAETRIELMRRRLAQFPGVEVRQGDAMSPPLEIGEVDAIVSRNLVWMLPDPAGALAEWSRLVGPGGRVAALDATRRLERNWLISMAWRLHGIAPVWKWKVDRERPVTLLNPAPFANLPGTGPVAAAWREAGLREVVAHDLSWVSTVRAYGRPGLSNLLHRSRYYAVLGDVGAEA
ncbi:MAG: putative SAM-dependent methyltransferase [Rubritepida sp.]|nr:putative SAM-dependent methyltransferase [Rubritepida sp.]